jgi:hypothetical protein
VLSAIEIENWPVELLSRTIWKPATAKEVPLVAALDILDA